MPSYEEVTQRAGVVRSMTGITEVEFHGAAAHSSSVGDVMQTALLMGSPAQAAATRRMTPSPAGRWPTAALHPDLRETESHSRSARTALWDVTIECHKWIHLLHPVLNRALADQESFRPVRPTIWHDAGDPRPSSFSPRPFFHDGTERPIQRRKT